jgi:hypothetical protein
VKRTGADAPKRKKKRRAQKKRTTQKNVQGYDRPNRKPILNTPKISWPTLGWGRRREPRPTRP